MNEYTPADVTDLLRALETDPAHAVDPSAAVSGGVKSLLYRGCASSAWLLVTSLQRLGPHCSSIEGALFEEFERFATDWTSSANGLWDVLATGQHYGLPTRLLDWTGNPDAALHFATADIDAHGDDGAVWVVNYERVHDLLPPDVKALLDKRSSRLFDVSLLAELAPSLDALDRLDDGTGGPLVMFLEPPVAEARIRAQDGKLSLMSGASHELSSYLDVHADVHRKILLPAAMKSELRAFLDRRDRTERAFFPDLGGLSNFLRRKYRDPPP